MWFMAYWSASMVVVDWVCSPRGLKMRRYDVWALIMDQGLIVGQFVSTTLIISTNPLFKFNTKVMNDDSQHFEVKLD